MCDVLLSSLFLDVPDILEPLLPKSRDAAADDDLQCDSDQHASTAADSTGDKQRHGGSTQQSSDLTVFLGECWLHLPPVTALTRPAACSGWRWITKEWWCWKRPGQSQSLSGMQVTAVLQAATADVPCTRLRHRPCRQLGIPVGFVDSS